MLSRSPPPCGEGLGGGGPRARSRVWLPPTPTLPRKGGGSREAGAEGGEDAVVRCGPFLRHGRA